MRDLLSTVFVVFSFLICDYITLYLVLHISHNFRSKRLAPVLIKEITRRVNLTDRWQAVYTAGVVLPRPVGRCRYYHRSLNPKKLIEVSGHASSSIILLFFSYDVE